MQQLPIRTVRPLTLALTVVMLLAFALCASCSPEAAAPAAATAASESSPVPNVTDVPTAPAAAAPYSAELSLARPADLAAGDLLLAQVCFKGGSNVAVEAPSSVWIPVLTTVSDSGAGIASFSAFVADPSAEPDAYAFRITAQSAEGGTIPAAGQILRYSGIDPSAPIAASVGCVGGGDAPYADGLTTDAPGVVVALFGVASDAQIDALSPDMAAMRTLGKSWSADGLFLFAADQDWSSGAFGRHALADVQSGGWASQLVSLRLVAVDVAFLAGDHGSLTASRVRSVSVPASGSIAPSAVPLVNADSGFAFLCWRGDDGKLYYDAAAIAKATLHAGDTFTAQYNKLGTYTVQFILGEIGASTDPVLFTGMHNGDTISIPNVTSSYSDWTFTGWDVEPSAIVRGDAVYYAQFAPLVYQVTFNLGDNGTSADTLLFSDLTPGDTITIPTVVPSEGFNFVGWDVEPETTVYADADYYAQYEAITYTVTFDLDGKGTSGDTLTFSGLQIGDSISIPEVTANTGYRFLGWNTEPLEIVDGNATYVAVYDIYRPK